VPATSSGLGLEPPIIHYIGDLPVGPTALPELLHLPDCRLFPLVGHYPPVPYGLTESQLASSFIIFGLMPQRDAE
jgi:hypothetical protein